MRSFLTSALCLLTSSAFAAAEADVLFLNARIFSGRDAETPQALALRGKRVYALGAAAEAARGSATTVIDLEGRWVLPAFNDAHTHPQDGGLASFAADLSTAASAADAAGILKAYAEANPGEPWLLGRGWSQTSWPGAAYPTRADLDAVTGERPALLEDVDGHQYWANSAALKAAGITAATKDPKSGTLLRGADGEPTGVFLEDAADLVRAAVPSPSPQRRVEALRLAVDQALRRGVTTLQGMLDRDAAAELAAWRELVQTGTVTVRYVMWGDLEDPQGFLRLKSQYGDLPQERFTFWGVKGFVDGVLAARTAALSKPYHDAPETYGSPSYNQARLNQLVFDANRRGLNVALHAVGDAAVRMALDAFAASRQKLRQIPNKKLPVIRNKIEHAEALDPRDLNRFRELDVVASMQPSHCTYDTQSQNYNDARLGSRARFAFAWRSLRDAGAPLAFGTDWPVMPLDPRVGLYAATTRQNLDGGPAGGWHAEQRLTLAEALSHYTSGGAYAEGKDREKGAVAPGMLADLVVLPAGLFQTQGAELLSLPVERVFFDGKQIVGPE